MSSEPNNKHPSWRHCARAAARVRCLILIVCPSGALQQLTESPPMPQCWLWAILIGGGNGVSALNWIEADFLVVNYSNFYQPDRELRIFESAVCWCWQIGQIVLLMWLNKSRREQLFLNRVNEEWMQIQVDRRRSQLLSAALWMIYSCLRSRYGVSFLRLVWCRLTAVIQQQQHQKKRAVDWAGCKQRLKKKPQWMRDVCLW